MPPNVANIGGYWLQLKCAKIQAVKQASKQHTSTASSTVPEVRFLTPCPDFLGRWTMKNHCKLKSLKSTLSSPGWFWWLIIAIETQECSWIIKSTKLEWVWYSFLVFLYFDIGSSAINLVWMNKTHFFFLRPENHTICQAPPIQHRLINDFFLSKEGSHSISLLGELSL